MYHIKKGFKVLYELRCGICDDVYQNIGKKKNKPYYKSKKVIKYKYDKKILMYGLCGECKSDVYRNEGIDKLLNMF